MNIGVLQFPGSNCDQDAFHLFANGLGLPTRYIWHKDTTLGDVDLVIVPGGFAYGDYLRCGAIARFSPVMKAVAAYADKGGLTEARLRMARAPDGASLIVNERSGAPGIRIGNIFILAGVPHIAAAMLDSLTGKLEGGRPLVSATIGGWIQESEVADLLAQTERDHPGSQIGSYPFFREGRTGANFVIRSTDATVLAACESALMAALLARGYEVVAGGI